MSSDNTPPGGQNQGWGAPPPAAQPQAPPSAGPGPGSPGWGPPPGGAPGAGYGPGAAPGMGAGYGPGAGPPGGMPPGGMPPGGVPPQGAWTPPPGGKPTNGNSGCGKVVLGIVGAGVLAMIGLGVLGVLLNDGGKAELVSADVSEERPGYNAHVDLTLVFLEQPKTDDPSELTNISLELTSIAFKTSPLTFDWDYIATNDDRPETVPGSPPPLGTEIRLTIPIDDNLLDSVTYDYSISMGVQLDWLGKRRDRENLDMMHIYPNPL